MLSRFAKFGIKKLDESLGGGLERNSLNLISGKTGTGKTILALTWLAEGAKNGEKCTFISTTMETDRIKNYMKRIIGNKVNKITFRDFTPEPKELMPINEEVIKELFDKKLRVEGKINRLVIDSISTFERVLLDQSMIRKFFYILSRQLAENKCTSIFVEEARKASSPIWDETRNICESFIELTTLPTRTKLVRALRIVKRYGVSHPLEWLPFEITNKGVKLLNGRYIERNEDVIFIRK